VKGKWKGAIFDHTLQVYGWYHRKKKYTTIFSRLGVFGRYFGIDLRIFKIPAGRGLRKMVTNLAVLKQINRLGFMADFHKKSNFLITTFATSL